MTDLQRYTRQMLIPGWGETTQQRLAEKTVFVAGAGGLGCPVALNLASAGVGHIRLCDCDVVDMTNLNRQFLHAEKNLGRQKTTSALEFLSSYNSGIVLNTLEQRITEESIDDLVGEADIILDCLDNFEARYALNHCAIRRNIPLVHGAVWGLEGRVTVLMPPETPCLACLFPVPPASEAAIPVLGVVTSSTGSLQAMEAIMYLTGFGPSLKGSMLIADYSSMQFQKLAIERKTGCPACGKEVSS